MCCGADDYPEADEGEANMTPSKMAGEYVAQSFPVPFFYRPGLSGSFTTQLVPTYPGELRGGLGQGTLTDIAAWVDQNKTLLIGAGLLLLLVGGGKRRRR